MYIYIWGRIANARRREFHPLELILLATAARRTMAANPVISPCSKRAHTETTVLGQLKKNPAEPRSCL
jgi:hypothetical protein